MYGLNGTGDSCGSGMVETHVIIGLDVEKPGATWAGSIDVPAAMFWRTPLIKGA